MSPARVGVDAQALARTESRIESRWEQLAEVLAGQPGEQRRIAHVMDQERVLGPSPLARVWLVAYLGWCIRHPMEIGDEGGSSYRCRCRDVGLVPVDGTRDDWRPCPSCNEAGYELWSGGHFAANHTCATCAPKGAVGRRGRRKADRGDGYPPSDEEAEPEPGSLEEEEARQIQMLRDADLL